MDPMARVPPDESLRIDTHLIDMEFLLTTILPASVPYVLHLLSRSFAVQALVATATIALVSASSPMATADPAAVLPSPMSLVAR